MWDDYHVFFIVTLVFSRLLLDDIYHLIELPFHWLIDEAMFFLLLDELIVGFCYSDLTWKTGGFELSLTITLYYKQTPKWNHRQSLIVNFYQANSELFRSNSEGVLKICRKFTGEHLCRSANWNRTSTWVFPEKQLYWNRISASMFSCKFAAYSKNDFSWGHLWVTSSGC